MSNSFLYSLCSASFLMHLSQDFGQLLHKQLEFFSPLLLTHIFSGLKHDDNVLPLEPLIEHE